MVTLFVLHLRHHFTLAKKMKNAHSAFTLRKHREEDKFDVIRTGYDTELFAGLGASCPRIPIEEYAAKWYALKTDPQYSWAIVASEICVGSVWIHSIEKENRRARFAIEIHNRDYRDRGIGCGAAKEVIKFAFEELKLHRLDLRVLVSNKRAIRCYESAGFVSEGIQRETLFLDGRWDSDLWMSILEYEYNKDANPSG